MDKDDINIKNIESNDSPDGEKLDHENDAHGRNPAEILADMMHQHPKAKSQILRILPILALAIFIGTSAYFVFKEPAEPEPVNPYRGGVVIGTCERAVEIVADMTLEEKVGQMFLTPYRGDGSDLEALTKYHLGGFLYTGEFFGNTNPENAPYIFRDMRIATQIRPFQAVAEEGGAFVAVSKWPAFRNEPFKLPRALYDEGGIEAVLAQEDEKLIMLKNLGLNMNFGPITNIVTSPAVSIYEQTLGQDAETTKEYIRQLALLYDECGVSSVLKYYTGSNTEAFMMGCYMGAPAVMMANSLVTGKDSVDQTMPLSLSRPWHNYLREELGFNGVIVISDIMSPVFDEYASGKAKSVTAVNAGNNMIWATDYENEIAAVIEAVKNGTVKMEDIDDSATRIITWKIRYGLVE